MTTTSRVYIIAILALSLVALCCGENFKLTKPEFRKYFNTTRSLGERFATRVEDLKQNVVNHTKNAVINNNNNTNKNNNNNTKIEIVVDLKSYPVFKPHHILIAKPAEKPVEKPAEKINTVVKDKDTKLTAYLRTGNFKPFITTNLRGSIFGPTNKSQMYNPANRYCYSILNLIHCIINF
jgi:hypothetical protein